MQTDKQIPFYAADGRPLGFRCLTAARRLIAGGFVKPSYGRKGHIRAIWLQREDGSSPVASHAPRGTSYSFVEPLEHGRCWSLRRIGKGDELRPIFTQVLMDCLVAGR